MVINLGWVKDQKWDDLLAEIKARVAKNERALVTTLTKKMAEDLTDYLLERGIKVEYLHSDVDTLRRVELLRMLREGKIDVIVGINLLREGLDCLQPGAWHRSQAPDQEDQRRQRHARQGGCGHPDLA